MARQPVTIGIDLGTSNSVVATSTPTGVKTVKDDQLLSTPSFVAFTGKERLVGEVARRQQPVNPHNTVHSIKQIIGRKFTDPVVARVSKAWAFTVHAAADGGCCVTVEEGGRQAAQRPEQISAAVLARLLANAQRRLNATSIQAVITVPASFTNEQRMATEDAAKIAGVQVLKLMNEPSAAAYVYGSGLLEPSPVARNMLVFDLGGGTFDVAVLHVPPSDASATEDSMRITGVDADLELGGDSFTTRLMHYCLDQLPGVDPAVACTPLVRSKIWRECESVKVALSERLSDTCNIELEGGHSVQLDISRQLFEELCDSDFQRIHGPLQRVLASSKLKRVDIDRVLLVGGSTRIPRVREILSEFFGDRVQLSYEVDPDEAVAHGAAIEAARLASLRAAEAAPAAAASAPDQLSGRSQSWDPNVSRDHAVSAAMSGLRGVLGAASRSQRQPLYNTMPEPQRLQPPQQPPVQPSQQQRQQQQQQLPPVGANFDVVPHTLSVVYANGLCWPMLLANTSYPREGVRQKFPKQREDQDSITISVVEGEAQRAVDNTLVGRFEVAGLGSLRRGIEIVFDVNPSGIVEVSATALDDPSNRKQISITRIAGGLSPQDINAMRHEEEGRSPQPPPLPPPLPPPGDEQRRLRELQLLHDEARGVLEDPASSANTVVHIRKLVDELQALQARRQVPSWQGLDSFKHRLEFTPVPGLQSQFF